MPKLMFSLQGRRFRMLATILAVLTLAAFSLRQSWNKPIKQDINRQLLKAISEDNVAAVADLLCKGADPNIHEGYLTEEASDSRQSSQLPFQLDKLLRLLHRRRQYWITSKQTALHVALLRGLDMEHVPANPAIVELLVRAGADVNAEGDGDWFPLAAAADTKQCGLVKLLLDYGAKVDKVDAVRGSAVFVAAARGDAATVKLLLQRGANPNLANAYGWTSLMRAVQSHNEEVVLLLLKSGASPLPQTCLGESALSLAISEHLPRIERMLRKQ